MAQIAINRNNTPQETASALAALLEKIGKEYPDDMRVDVELFEGRDASVGGSFPIQDENETVFNELHDKVHDETMAFLNRQS